MLPCHLFCDLLISIIICPHHDSHLDSLRVNSPGGSSCFILWWCRARFALSFTDDLTLLYFWTEFNYRLWPQLPWRGYLGWLVVSALHETLLIRIRPMIGRADSIESLHSQYAWACVCLYMRLRRKTDKGDESSQNNKRLTSVLFYLTSAHPSLILQEHTHAAREHTATRSPRLSFWYNIRDALWYTPCVHICESVVGCCQIPSIV